MSEENNIKTFTATDIEKYWMGKLSPSEMHAMEKAAMDDPFLADALEGYRHTATADADLNRLREKLDKRVIALAPVIPLQQKRFPWLKIAAAIIIIGGIGVLVQQFVLNNKNSSPLAVSRSDEKQKAEVSADSNNQASAATSTKPETEGSFITIRPDSSSIITQRNASNNLSATISDDKSHKDTFNFSSGLASKGKKKTDFVKIDSTSGNDVISGDVNTVKAPDKLKDKIVERKVADTSDIRDFAFKDKDAPVPTAKQRASEGALSYDFYKNSNPVLNHKFSYRVVDAQNNPVPFANVMNTRDNIGTYTDIRGNFNLVSSDSILNVQVKSLGFLSNNYKLVPSGQFKSLTLKEDYYARRQILDSSRQLVSNKPRIDTAELEEPEVGWGYFNTYVANNIQIPENIRKKSTLSNVELSFDIDENGQPINIKVTKSSKCKECDSEAIRLLKEGPKWKKKGRRSKTTISIAVDQK